MIHPPTPTPDIPILKEVEAEYSKIQSALCLPRRLIVEVFPVLSRNEQGVSQKTIVNRRLKITHFPCKRYLHRSA